MKPSLGFFMCSRRGRLPRLFETRNSPTRLHFLSGLVGFGDDSIVYRLLQPTDFVKNL